MHEYAGVKERWHRLSPGTQSLPYWQAEAIAGEIYRSMTADRHDDPQQASITSLSTEKAFVNGPPKIAFAGKNEKGTAALVEKLRTSRNAKRIDGWLSAHGYILTPDSQELVRKAVDKAFLQALEQRRWL